MSRNRRSRAHRIDLRPHFRGDIFVYEEDYLDGVTPTKIIFRCFEPDYPVSSRDRGWRGDPLLISETVVWQRSVLPHSGLSVAAIVRGQIAG